MMAREKILTGLLLLIAAFHAKAQPSAVLLTDALGNYYPTGSGTPLGYTPRAMACYTSVAGGILPCTFAQAPVFFFGGFGDSYIVGSGALAPSVGGGYAQLAKAMPAVNTQNYGVTGTTSDTINLSLWKQIQNNPQLPAAYIIDGGANDGACGNSTGCITNFEEEVNSSIARATIPNQERTMASTCTQTAGTWTADTAVYTLPAPTYYLNPGTAMSATGSGAILTCTVTSRSTSIKVGLNFQVTNAQTGTFTVTVDGVSQTDQCSGTTTFTSAPCSGVNLLTQTTTAFRQEFAGTPGTTHTVVVTTTNAAKVNVTAVDAITTSPQVNSNYVVAFGPNAAFTNAVQYDAAMGTVANQLNADGARVAFADIQSTTNPGPGVNNTTDIAQTATANCTASANVNHPNDVCGYLHLAQTIANAAKLQGWNIFGTPESFNGGSTTAFLGIALTQSAISANSCAIIPGSVWTVAGVTHTSEISNGWSGDPGGTVGQLTIVTAPTDAGTVVGRICNGTSAAITPSGQAINWWVVHL